VGIGRNDQLISLTRSKSQCVTVNDSKNRLLLILADPYCDQLRTLVVRIS